MSDHVRPKAKLVWHNVRSGKKNYNPHWWVCVSGYLYMCADVITVGDNKKFTFHICTIIVRTKNLCSVLRNFFHTTIANSAIITVPSMWLNLATFIPATDNEQKTITQLRPFNKAYSITNSGIRYVVPRAFTWWAGFCQWSIVLLLYLWFCKSCGNWTKTSKESDPGSKSYM